MSRPDPKDAAPLHALLRHATSLESRGDWSAAVAAWTEIVRRFPAHPLAPLGLAQAQIRSGRPDAALPALERARALAPGQPAAWLATAVAQSMIGRHDDAVASARRAVALAPSVAAVHLGLGDVLRQSGDLEAASDAYRHAVALAPDDADANSKAAVAERLVRRLDEAEALLRRALARVPDHPYACVNLATLLLERGRIEEGSALLESASKIATLPPDARSEIADARTMLAERASLSGPLSAALERDDPAPLAAGLHALRRSGSPDAPLIRDMARLAARAAVLDPVDASCAAGTPRSTAWPAIEAHHNVLASRDDDAISRSVALVGHPDRAFGDADLDVLHYARAVERSSARPPDDRDPEALEAWLRLRHAQLAIHRPARGPGQAPGSDNVGGTAVNILRSTAATGRATLRALVADIAPGVPVGVLRAAFLYTALLEMHPFSDANGRVARLALNRWLEAAGRFPYLRQSESDARLLAQARATGDLRPVLAFIGAGSRYAAALDGTWTSREARSRSGGSPSP